MSINYCTISTSTIDGFCGIQRSKVIARLLDEKYPVVNPPTPSPRPGSGGVTYGGMPGRAPNPWFDPYTSDTTQPIEYEQPYITVRVSDLFGEEGSETLFADAQMSFVTVTNLEFEDEDDISVNITGLEI